MRPQLQPESSNLTMISSDSSSDSDASSDSEAERLAVQAFESIKAKLNVSKRKTPGPSKLNPEICSNSTSFRKKVYETFTTDSESEDEKYSVKSSRNNNKINSDKQMFFLDKNPASRSDSELNIDSCPQKNDNTNRSVASKTDTDENTPAQIETTEVIVTDLSTLITDKASEEPQCVKAKRKKPPQTRPKDRSRQNLASTLESGVKNRDSHFYINVDPEKDPLAQRKIVSDQPKELEVMKKCVIADDFEKQDSLTPFQSVRQQKKDRRIERAKTKGDKWFNMPAPEITEERKHDLEVLSMRKVLDPKRFYKAADTKGPPKYFQFGRVVETAADFYTSRVPKKQRKSTMVEELLADAQFRSFNKRKYEEIQDMKRLGKGPYERLKRIRKKKRKKQK